MDNNSADQPTNGRILDAHGIPPFDVFRPRRFSRRDHAQSHRTLPVTSAARHVVFDFGTEQRLVGCFINPTLFILPESVKSAETLATFKRKLKTYLFNISF